MKKIIWFTKAIENSDVLKYLADFSVYAVH